MFEDLSQPAKKRTGLAKAATLFAAIFGISFGLCGMNIIASMMGANPLQGVLVFTAYAEAAGMVVGFVGLLFIGIVYVISAITDRF